ncbi:hypothetical protein IJ798_00485 [Candidatus Saccharibacteria bacterium]|nr:hypothetical protein [Candidatus Saccharibacteria bacterium]
MAQWIQFGGNWSCPRCGKTGFPNEAAANACSCASGGQTKKCPDCQGRGYEWGNSQIMCQTCGGTGEVRAW